MPLWLKVIISVVSVELLGGLGAAVTGSEIAGWYAGLERPAGTPPNWVFGPVWITLYAMMGVAFALVWHRASDAGHRGKGLTWFAVQLVLNLAWTPVFFGLHQMLAALVIILALGGAIVMTILHFRKVSPVAAVLLVPYLLWVGYATYLNAGYWWLNR